MSVSSRLKGFQDRPSPAEKHKDGIRFFAETVTRMHGMFKEREGPVRMVTVSPKCVDESEWQSFQHFYLGHILPIKQNARKDGVYLEYSDDKEDIITGDIFHEASVGGVPVLFVCNTRHSDAKAKFKGFSRLIHTPIGSYEEISIFCDSLAPQVQESMQFFSAGSSSGVYYPPLKDASLFRCASADDIRNLAERIVVDLPLIHKILWATELAMEAKEFTADESRMLDRRILAMGCHELAHVFFARSIFQFGGDLEFDETASLAAELAYSDLPLSRLGEILHSAHTHLSTIEERDIVVNFNHFLLNTLSPAHDGILIPSYIGLTKESIVFIAKKILEGLYSKVFGVGWARIADTPVFESLRHAIMEDKH